MTIAASWVRKIHNCEELIFISDSRLCGGHRWDECPKLTTLPGNTCALVQKFLNKWTIFLFCSILFSSNQKEH